MNENNFFAPITCELEMNASKEKVWEVISSPGNLEKCHPYCLSNPVEKWPGKDSVDFVNYYSGIKYKRTFTEWHEGEGYDLLIGVKFGKKSKVVWRIKKIDYSNSILEIKIFPYRMNKYPRLIESLFYKLYIKPMLKKYLSSVLKGFRYYITTGNEVKKDQFGKHKWYSDN